MKLKIIESFAMQYRYCSIDITVPVYCSIDITVPVLHYPFTSRFAQCKNFVCYTLILLIDDERILIMRSCSSLTTTE